MAGGSFIRHTRRRVVNVTATMLGVFALVGVVGGLVSAAYAQAPWSALPGSCASTDNNFYNGTPSNDYPVARFRVPGGSIAFNGFHDGYIAVICSVDNPPRCTAPCLADGTSCRLRIAILTAWVCRVRKAQNTKRMLNSCVSQRLPARGRKSPASTATCSALAAPVSARPTTLRRLHGNFSHTFDFDNYAYAVYGRLYRALATFSLTPVIYQLRLQAAPIVVQPGPVVEFGGAAIQ